MPNEMKADIFKSFLKLQTRLPVNSEPVDEWLYLNKERTLDCLGQVHTTNVPTNY